jgi:branched-chain amino acid transport system substrate-binding protein
MRKILPLSAVFLFLNILLFNPAGWSENPADLVKIGATLALSGKYSYIAEAERDGLILAQEEINSAGGIAGKRIELIFEDNTGDAKTAVGTVRKLLHVDQVDIILSAFTHITQAVKDIVARENKVMLYASTVKEIAASNTFFFRDYSDVAESGVVLAKLADSRGYKKVALVRDEGDVCGFLEKAFLQEADKLEIKFLSKQEYISGETDFRPLLLRALQSKPQALVFCAWRDTHLIMKQLSDLGRLAVPTLHAFAPFLPAADTQTIRRLYELNGTISTWHGFLADSEDETSRAFVGKFRNRFNRDPLADSAYFYDDLYALAAASADCLTTSGLDSECLKSNLLKINLKGVAGQLSFDRHGNAKRGVLVITVKSGQWEISEAAGG